MGFAQEIKDFLSAAKSTQQIFAASSDEEYKKARTEYQRLKVEQMKDPERTKLEMDTARARLRQIEAGTARSNASTALANTRRRLLTQPPPDDGEPKPWTTDLRPPGPQSSAIPVPGATPTSLASGPQMAIPTETALAPQAVVQPEIEAFDLANWDPSKEDYGDDEDETTMPVTYAGNGGMIGHYATGGLVGAIPDAGETAADEADEEDEGESNPGEFQIAQGYSPLAAHDATRDALDYGTKQLQQPAAPGMDPKKRSAMSRAYLAGAGSLSYKEMEQVRKVVDPQGKMSPSNRNMAALANVYQYFLNKGDTRAAKAAAFSILQHYRQASQRYAAIAAVAANNGNIDEAARAAMKAYDNIPTGNDLKVRRNGDRLEYVLRDEKTGKEVTKGVATPQELAAGAMRVSVEGFDQFIMEAAGARAAPAKKSAGVSSSGPKPKDFSAIRDEMDKYLGDKVTKAEEKGVKIPESQLNLVRNYGSRIIGANPGIGPDEAADMLDTIVNVPAPKVKGKDGKEVDGEAPFRVTPNKDGPSKIEFSDGREIMLPEKEIRPLLIMRQQQLKKNAEAAAKAKENEGKPGVLSRIMDAIGTVDNAAGESMGKAVTAMRNAFQKFRDDNVGALEEMKYGGNRVSRGFAAIDEENTRRQPN